MLGGPKIAAPIVQFTMLNGRSLSNSMSIHRVSPNFCSPSRAPMVRGVVDSRLWSPCNIW